MLSIFYEKIQQYLYFEYCPNFSNFEFHYQSLFKHKNEYDFGIGSLPVLFDKVFDDALQSLLIRAENS